MTSQRSQKAVESFIHDEASRRYIPTAELEPVMQTEDQSPIRVAYERRNRDLDPQLVWRGKDEQDWSDLVVSAPPLFVQEKIHPKYLIDDLRLHPPVSRSSNTSLSPREGERAGDRGVAPGSGAPAEGTARSQSGGAPEQGAPAEGTARSQRGPAPERGTQLDLFADFNGLPEGADRTDFYQHDAHWSNRMILGDSLQVMASLAEREGLRGQVQCIYLDPPYGIKFNSNFQWSTTSRDVRDGNPEHITREPEQVKAFRDTWRDGIHSYLTYLRDRLTVARDLLTDSGSIFVQIGDENVHRVRALMDEVFGEENHCGTITFVKNSGATDELLPSPSDHLVWFARDKAQARFRRPFLTKAIGNEFGERYGKVREGDGLRRPLSRRELEDPSRLPPGAEPYTEQPPISAGYRANTSVPFHFRNQTYDIGKQRNWKTHLIGMERLGRADRLIALPKLVYYERRMSDFPLVAETTLWTDTQDRLAKNYVVETVPRVIERCLLMATDPGDLVLDPTCGSGTTACVAEQWGRRWITIDTSRVALALARARIMGARFPYYLLADSREGQHKEADVTRTAPSSAPVYGNLRQGFVYERVPHIQLRDIANNAEIDVIWERFQETLEPLRAQLNAALGQSWEEWQIPREAGAGWPEAAEAQHAEWWKERIARQKAIDASIAAKAEFEYLYDKPYVDNKKVRVAGPFTVESLSPHRVLGVDENDELIDPLDQAQRDGGQDFATMILENLRTAGVQQAHKDDRIAFTALTPWPGRYICAEGVYEDEQRAASSEQRGTSNEGRATGNEQRGTGNGQRATGNEQRGTGNEQRAASSEQRVGSGETGSRKRAGIFIGPEFGTVSRPDLVAATREAADAGFDVLIACAFNYDALSSEFNRLGRIPVLKARMNADLHMAADLKNTGKGNLFVVFGEPDISILDAGLEPPLPGLGEGRGEGQGAPGQIRVRVNGVDVFHPSTGEVRSDGPDGIACWFIDTDYNEESFFVRHAYFLGANDPYKALKTTLKAEIDEEAWESLHSDTSRPFDKPQTGRIAVKVINHLGDEVMKVFRVE